MGDGAKTETRETPAAKATSQGGLPYAETPNARQTPKGMYRVSGTQFKGLVHCTVCTQEVELQGRRDQFQIEELRQQQLLEKRQLPKKLKAEHKAQVAELRKASRNKRTDNDREKLRQLDEQYVRKSQLETELMNEKHEKSMETLRAELEANMRDLQEIQVNTV